MDNEHSKSLLTIKSQDPEIIFGEDGETLSEFIKSISQKWKTSHFLECGITGKVYTYEDAMRLSRAFSSNLRKLPGIKKGAIVSMILPTSVEFVIALLGIWDAGCIVCPFNPLLTQREIVQLLAKCGAKCFIAENGSQLNFSKESMEDITLQAAIIVNDDSEKSIESSFNTIKTIKFSSVLQNCGDEEVNEEKPERNRDSDVAAILYSSGTTGNPKGIQLTHSNLRFCTLQCLQRDEKRRKELKTKSEQDVVILVLPLCHVYAICVLLMTLSQGGKAILLPKYNQEIYTKAIIRHKPTVYHVVPPILHSMINNPALKQEHLEMAHTISYGAAPISEYLLQKLSERFGGHIFLRQLYGMSEIAVALIVDSGYGNTKKDSIGRLLAGLEAKVVDISTGECLGPYEIGELCIKGPNVMKGYLNNEDATKETIDEDGFLHTGDMVRYDEDGWFYIVDRIKDVIKVKGYHVSPSEIEEQLLKLDGIADVAVIRIPFKSTEAPRAYIVTNRDSLSADEIHSYVKENLAPYKQLKGGIEFVSQIPRSATGKILKQKLLEKYLEKIIQL